MLFPPLPQLVYRIGFGVHFAEDPKGAHTSPPFREWRVPHSAVLLPEVTALVRQDVDRCLFTVL